MIRSFKDADTSELFLRGKQRRFASIAKVALRKLSLLATAEVLEDLRQPPGNRLETLQRERAGQHSIRINDQYRICFVWKADGPHEVEIVDYH